MSADHRPRPKAPLRIDPGNAYARLGVSPLASTDEIKKVLADRRARAMAARRSRSDQQFGDDDDEILRLQAIEKDIGTPQARAAYDQAQPQNALLTVQPGPRDRLEPARRLSLVTAWLLEELGADAGLLHPDAHDLWLPAGLDRDLVAALAGFAQTSAAPLPASADTLAEPLLEVGEIGSLFPSRSPEPTE